MSQNLLHILRSDAEALSGVERKIANLILEDPKSFMSRSLTEVSELAQVSQGSIINFAKKFAGGGFPALKLQIASNIADYQQQPFSVIDKEDTVKDIFHKIINSDMVALKNTAALGDEETFHRVVRKILCARKVELYGIFHSAVIATDFQHQLLQLGIPASYAGDVLTSAIQASMLEPDCLVIAVSFSGRTKDVIDAVKLAKAGGVPVVCLTSNPNAPLAKLADDVLVAASGGSSIGETSSEIRSSMLLLTDAICSYLRSKIDEAGEKRYFEFKKILESHGVKD